MTPYRMKDVFKWIFQSEWASTHVQVLGAVHVPLTQLEEQIAKRGKYIKR